MRVHERGSGETRSCGTGACAVMVAAALADGDRPAARTSPTASTSRAARLTVTWTADDRVLLTGSCGDRRVGADRPLTRCCALHTCVDPEERRGPTPTLLRRHGHHRSQRHRHRRRVGHRRGRRPPARRAGAPRSSSPTCRRTRARRSPTEIGGVFAQVDVTNTDDIIAAVELAVEIGPLRALVNSAGIGWAQRTIGKDGQYESAHDLDAFKKVIAINLIGTFDCSARPRRR